MNPAIFREYDIRGLAKKDFNTDFVLLLGKVHGTAIISRGGKRAAVGCDCRATSEGYADAVIAGMASARATEYFRRHYDGIDLDGVRVRFPEGWGLIRASNTQSALVLRFEAQTMATLNEYCALVERKLREFDLQ